MFRAVLIFTCLLISLSLTAQVQVIDKVVAQVGSELVLLSEVEEQRALIESQQGSALPPDARCFILDGIMAQKLLVNQAKIDSVLVTEEEVEVQLDARVNQILDYMGGSFEQFEAYYGQSVNAVKDQFREDLRSQLLAERMRGEIISTITVTPAEVKTFFARIPSDSLPYFNSEVELSELVYSPQVSEEERDRAITQLEEIRRQILIEGADFAEMARTHSDDFASGRLGGDLGWTRRGRFVPAFEAAAYNLEVDEISEVVETEFGYHIIQLLGRRGNSINARHILLRPEITEADLERAREELDSIRTLIQDSVYTFSAAVKKFGNDEVPSFNNDGRMVNQTTGNTFFEIGDLEPDVFFTIDTMDVGTISDPFSYQTQSGETMFRIVRLNSRSVPHRASLQTDYSRIQAAAIEEKQSRFINGWIRDKIDNTYIEVDPMFSDCESMQEWIDDER